MAIYKTFEVALELKQTSTNPTFSVTEGDTGNRLHISVTDGGSAVDLTDCRIIAAFSKSNGTSMQDSGVEGGGITIGGTNNNEVTVDIFASSISPGNVECELQIYSGEDMATLVTSARFNFACRRGIMNEDVLLSTNEYPLLVDLISTVEGFVDVEEGRVIAEQERVIAEQERVDAENDRVTAEAERANAESLRVSAEAERASAESGRAAEMAKWASANAVANTLPAGSSATATLSEVGGVKRFTFGIPKGDTGEQGIQGLQGIQGVQGVKGDKGDKGDTGGYYSPAVDTNGNITFTASRSDMPAVSGANIRGPQGIQGEVGPVGPQGTKGDKGDTGPAGPQGPKGDTGSGFAVLGYYATAAALAAAITNPDAGDAYGVGTAEPYDIYIWDGINSTWVNNGPLQGAKGDKGDKGDTGEQGPQGEQGIQGETGPAGPQGEAGYSPVRGTDYWTATDIAEIKSYVDDAILGGAW